jgi:hypothetical protein
LDVPGRPSCGFQRGFTSVAVFVCSLMVVGVPVNVPVRASKSSGAICVDSLFTVYRFNQSEQ